VDERPICHLCKKPIGSKKELCRWGMFKISFAHHKCYAEWYEKAFDKKFSREVDPESMLASGQFYSRKGFSRAVVMMIIMFFLLVKIEAEYLILIIPLALLLYALSIWQFIISMHNSKEIRKAKNLP
jgi:hypothetical protein